MGGWVLVLLWFDECVKCGVIEWEAIRDFCSFGSKQKCGVEMGRA